MSNDEILAAIDRMIEHRVTVLAWLALVMFASVSAALWAACVWAHQ